jgi:PAS domain S-box-containing protein
MAINKETETQYKLLRTAMMDAFAAVDMTGRYREANQTFLDIVGYKREELLELHRHALTPEKWHALENRMINEQVLVRGYSEVFQKELRRKDGGIVPVELRIVLTRDPDGKPIGMWAILRDITDRIRGEEKLRRFQHSVESSPDAVFWINAEGRFSYVNEQACRSLAYSHDELTQLRLWDIDVDFSREQWGAHWEAVSKAGGAQLERRHRRKDGTVFPVEISSHQVFLNNQKHHVAYVRDISKRRKTDDELRFFKHAIDTAPEGVFWMTQNGVFIYVNDRACKSLGYTREELLKMHLWDIDPTFPPERWAAHWVEMRTIQSRLIETVHRRKDGTLFPIEVSAYRLPYGDEESHLAFVRDITERQKAAEDRNRLEAQLLQAQKLESIGRLAGGVAHDYNNMLGVIIGYSEIMRTKIAPGDPLLKDLGQIQRAAERSKNITQQLLAFSRKQVFEPKILEINDLIHNFEGNLSRLIGEDIELHFIPSQDTGKIVFDPTQIEQILMNLAVNARDAMPNGGKLTIETNNVVLDEAYCREHAGFMPGCFVRLSVSDNGVGMRKETINQIFEPFFTTKDVGKGTGLGLATVYGIVKQGGGFINVYSEPGQGTTFKIYIPKTTGETEVLPASDSGPPESGSETFLLVEDDEMVRSMTEIILENLGHKVISAGGPEEAIEIFEKEHASIDLLITDVVMPKMNGKELHDRLKSICPELKVLFMSGYTTNVIVHHGVLDKGVHLISKPFCINELAAKIRKTLADA